MKHNTTYHIYNDNDGDDEFDDINKDENSSKDLLEFSDIRIIVGNWEWQRLRIKITWLGQQNG